MPSLEESFEAACKDGTIPGAVLLATNKSGSFQYAKAFGSRSLGESKSNEPLEMNAVMFIASCTKLMTSIAAMQCVERGQISLDDDVSDLLPELARLEILAGSDNAGNPVLRRRKNPITLRLLLTRSSGLCYDAMHPALMRYRQHRGEPLSFGVTILERFNAPLVFEPGTDWLYSPSIDYAGLLVERLTGLDLEAYMQKHLWAPLGITDITFWPSAHPDLANRLTDMTVRDPAGSGRVVHYPGPTISTGAKECMGGQGAYAAMPDYLKILHSLLVDDERLLRRDTAATMFSPQLTPQSREGQKKLMARPDVAAQFVGYFPPEVKMNWGLGGILITEDDTTEGGCRKKGSMIWSGMPNLFWFIDREAGLCGLYGGQVLPAGDAQTGRMITLFERAMYAKSAAAGPKARI
ncbi:hypothetical protein B0A49_03504 [Cryomyces minteri]|uniref:Beta-lactamase-related domain-containing protein n=2 Tax=Cryomyces minteri TaxID=331657 RepID=A0A4U0XLU4_9PEZI|nr:hypothetical protein B0A49_03504 [Cryomyces minteri]